MSLIHWRDTFWCKLLIWVNKLTKTSFWQQEKCSRTSKQKANIKHKIYNGIIASQIQLLWFLFFLSVSMQNNELEKIPAGAFDNLFHLRELYLQNNFLSNDGMDNETFRSAWHIIYLTLFLLHSSLLPNLLVKPLPEL